MLRCDWESKPVVRGARGVIITERDVVSGETDERRHAGGTSERLRVASRPNAVQAGYEGLATQETTG